MRKPYNLKKMTNQDLEKLLKALVFYAQVNPENLKTLSLVLKRELAAEKDTEDYNTKLISSILDKTTLFLRNAGQKDILQGDSIKIDEEIESKLKEAQGGDDDLPKEDYIPFSWKVAQELRAKFILKTEASDTFESLMDEADGLISSFLSVSEWVKIKAAMKRAESRFVQSNLMFLEPEETIGEISKLSNTEIQKYNIRTIDRNVMVDNRNDSHDLLALKEFVSMLKGEEIYPFSIGPGFLAKYMPELKDVDIDAVIFQVRDNKLTEIALQKSKQLLEYGPLTAAQELLRAYSRKEVETVLKTKRYNVSPVNIFFKNTKYFVVVDGTVSAPIDGLPLNYESLSKNGLRIPAGEVFLFEAKSDKDINATRLYFTPYEYNKLHPIHQHGSVIFGNNDQSFHSCMRDEENFFDYSSKNDLLRELKDSSYIFAPSFVAAALHDLPKGNTAMQVLRPENKEILVKAMGSLYEETSFTLFHLILSWLPDIQETEAGLIFKYLKNCSSLSKKLIVKDYLNQKTDLPMINDNATYNLLAKQADVSNTTKRVLNFLKLNPPTED